MKPTARLLRGPVEAMNLSRGRRFRPALRIVKECGGHACAYSACHPQAMRRQVRRDAQLARDVPSGSLPALRDADLVITQEPATLQHIPMFGAHDRARYMR